jgi:hypothetical protein
MLAETKAMMLVFLRWRKEVVIMDKNARKILAAAEKQGFTWKLSSKGHPQVYRDGAWVAAYSGTPGDQRALRNFLAQLRRAGFTWPPK